MELAPAGTAIHADVVLLLDVPAPWPKPITSHPRLSGIVDDVAVASPRTRLFASMPADDRTRLTVFRNEAGRGVRATYVITNEEATADAVFAAIAGAETPGMELVEEPAFRPSLLVCTQGTHDICCGSDGVRLSGDVARNLPDVDVYRISHTGGHRFAPTAMSMPDGRMWAWLDLDDVRNIFETRGDHADLARRCRGWWGAAPGAPQAAEIEVFRRLGWEASPRSVEGDTSPYTVRLEDRSIRVRVEEARAVPTIACRAPGGRPFKESVEFRSAIL